MVHRRAGEPPLCVRPSARLQMEYKTSAPPREKHPVKTAKSHFRNTRRKGVTTHSLTSQDFYKKSLTQGH
jgi:hypothetical protein